MRRAGVLPTAMENDTKDTTESSERPSSSQGTTSQPQSTEEVALAKAEAAAALCRLRTPPPIIGWLCVCLLLCGYVGAFSWYVGISNQLSADFKALDPSKGVHLGPGWFLGRDIDLSDGQWASLRNSAGSLALALGFFVAVSLTLKAAAPDALRSTMLRWFYALYGAVLIFVLHGISSVFPLALFAFYFGLSRWFCSSQHYRAGLWTLSIFLMYVNEAFDGYRFAWLGLPSWLDDSRGAYRWHIGFNLSLLKVLSFCFDYQDAVQATATFAAEDAEAGNRLPAPVRAYESLPLRSASSHGVAMSASHSAKELAALATASARVRNATSHDLSKYSYLTYMSYVLYPPLYIAGPTVTANSFLADIFYPRVTAAEERLRTCVLYILRAAAAVLVIEIWLHYIYSYAFQVWAKETGYVISESMGFFPYYYLTVATLSFKFSALWKFFRAFAMVDGVETVENLGRCVFNVESVRGFWQTWHASFNVWLIRYIYVPMGGRRRQIASIVAVFAFTAYWHDKSIAILIWGVWVVGASILEFIVPMIYYRFRVLKRFSQTSKWSLVPIVLAQSQTCIHLLGLNMIGFGGGLHALYGAPLLKVYGFIFPFMLLNAVSLVFLRKGKLQRS